VPVIAFNENWPPKQCCEFLELDESTVHKEGTQNQDTKYFNLVKPDSSFGPKVQCAPCGRMAKYSYYQLLFFAWTLQCLQDTISIRTRSSKRVTDYFRP